MYVSCAGINVVPIQRDENVFFISVSFCIHTEDKHSEIRLSTTNKIINVK